MPDNPSETLARRVLACLPYQPDDEQMLLIAGLSRFIAEPRPQSAFLLRGYAGTGKTSIVGAFVKALTFIGAKTILLAPTGRAAHVMSDYAGHTAFTIHRRIYRQQRYGSEAFLLAENKHTDTLFIVDEASMIANGSADSSAFGTGRLLDDLIGYVYSGEGCRLLLVGDNAQLPPVGQTESPAMNAATLQGYGLSVMEMTLRSPARQAADSAILYNATLLRQAMETDITASPRLRLDIAPDLTTIDGGELIDQIDTCYNRDTPRQTIIITRSNYRATQFNLGIRNQILYREELLSAGDMLLVAKNNYYWSRDNDAVDFIANGDVAVVRRVRGDIERVYGLQFATVVLTFPDHDDAEMEVKVIVDTLLSDAPALTREQQERLYAGVMAEIEGDQRARIAALKNHDYYNALQVKFGYAVTCHKAQGGQWDQVFIDMGGIAPEATTTLDYHRWLYTALTRARRHVYLINYLK